MTSLIAFYLLMTLLGWIAFPITYRFFPSLADRGYTLGRSLGLLLWGFIFWLLASLGVAQNDVGGILLAFCLLLALSIWAFWPDGLKEIFSWVREAKKLIIVSEILFLLAFVFLCLLRATDPAITGTEKPMELAFINAILRSPSFPPNDPWLSGYSISYYYFGYVMVAMLAKVTGTAGSVAFNLGIALCFSLAALGAYGIVYNLFACVRRDHGLPLLGPLFLLIVSNLEGFLEMLHARGLFWHEGADGALHSQFWEWLGILEINKAPSQPFSWLPNRSGGIWWWRASRVLQDYDFSNQWKEIIDEFPFFSYYLADLHPHVLTMPFALLAIGLSLNFLLSPKEKGFSVLGVHIPLNLNSYLLSTVILGGLAFLNTWDFPIYVAIFCAVYLLRQVKEQGWQWKRLGEFITLGLALGIGGVILYLPFYVGFSSQAGGFLPSMIYSTRGVYFWVMFAPLALPVLAALIYLWVRLGMWVDWKRWLVAGALAGIAWILIVQGLAGLAIPVLLALVVLIILWRKHWPASEFGRSGLSALVVVTGLCFLSFFFAWMILNLSTLGNVLADFSGGAGRLSAVGMTLSSLGDRFVINQGAQNGGELLAESILRRLKSPGTWLSLTFILTLTWGLIKTYLFTNSKVKEDLNAGIGVFEPIEDKPSALHPVQVFVLLLILAGALLVLTPEYIYLLDQFGWRMNTIFKFYFQAWMVWSLAAAYATSLLLIKLRKAWGWVFRTALIVLMIMSLAYPFFGLRERFNSLGRADNLSLDGAEYLSIYAPDDWAAIEYLRNVPVGVITEAVGGSYSGYARISTHSGMPTVIGWPGHESQWRGTSEELTPREEDIKMLYQTSDWGEAQQIINRYHIQYIVIGTLERGAYRVNEIKFQRALRSVFRQNDVVIYKAETTAE